MKARGMPSLEEFVRKLRTEDERGDRGTRGAVDGPENGGTREAEVIDNGGTGEPESICASDPIPQTPSQDGAKEDFAKEHGKDRSLHESPVLPTPEPVEDEEIAALPPYAVTDADNEVRNLGLHDNGNARRFAIHHGDRLRYVSGWGWLRYKSGKWSRIDDVDVQEFGKRTARDLLAVSATAVSKGLDSVQWQQLLKHAFVANRWNSVKKMIELARSEPALKREASAFDKRPDLLNVANGMVDLRTGTLRPHSQDDNSTRQVKVPFVAQSTCPQWMRFLADATGGDQALADYLQMAVGYTLTGETREHALFFLFGDGRNGKTTFLETVRYVLGDYSENVPTGYLMADRSNNKDATSARLQHCRMVTLAEAGEKRRFDESFLKQVTGEDLLPARPLYGVGFSYRPSFKLWVHGNSKPRIEGSDLGIWRRFRLVPLVHTVPEDKCDPLLKDKLRAEAPGILAWAVEGARRWYENGKLVEPPCMREALQVYRNDMDLVQQFVNEQCDLDDKAETRAQDLLGAFNNWLAACGYRSFNAQRFGRRLVAMGLDKATNGRGQVVYSGIALKL